VNADLILFVNDIITSPASGQRYQIIDLLGQGTFGQVRLPFFFFFASSFE
jgi:hypothetical protein